MHNSYLSPLPDNTTLCVFSGDKLIFSDNGKWLMPLFSFERFMNTHNISKDNLCAHDSAVGKAAAVLMVRLGIKNIFANIASALAEDYIAEVNKTLKDSEKISFSYINKVPRLLCATESFLSSCNDSDTMYAILRQRAKLVQGVDVCTKK